MTASGYWARSRRLSSGSAFRLTYGRPLRREKRANMRLATKRTGISGSKGVRSDVPGFPSPYRIHGSWGKPATSFACRTGYHSHCSTRAAGGSRHDRQLDFQVEPVADGRVFHEAPVRFDDGGDDVRADAPPVAFRGQAVRPEQPVGDVRRQRGG